MIDDQTQDTQEKDPIARAYAHMDEVTQAHGRGEETADEKRLRDAREGKPDPASTPKPKRTYRPKPSAAAEAWLRRQRQDRERPSITVTTPEEAIGKWRAVQFSQGVGRILPSDGSPNAGAEMAVVEMSSLSTTEQVWMCVRLTPGFDGWLKGWKPDEAFHAEIAKWLPRTFRAPLPRLAPAEEDEQRRGRKEIEDAVKAQEAEGQGDRLMLGMVRNDDC